MCQGLGNQVIWESVVTLRVDVGVDSEQCGLKPQNNSGEAKQFGET